MSAEKRGPGRPRKNTTEEEETEPATNIKSLPPIPKPKRGMGDKTPEIVRWYHAHDFPEFKRRYRVQSDQPEADGRYVAHRETCLTRRVRTGDNASEYAD